MITINGKKMGKSYNNVIKLSELFTGNHPLLEQAYHPMTIRFFILQTHYSSTLDFSNEALKSSEKGLKRLWESYENLQKLEIQNGKDKGSDAALEARCLKLVAEFDEFMSDDFNTAKVLANMFELVPIINSVKDKHISSDALSAATLQLVKNKMKLFIEDVLGLKNIQEQTDSKIDGIIHLLMNMRKDARQRKDYVTSDKIRNELAALGVQLKDEKDGSMSYALI